MPIFQTNNGLLVRGEPLEPQKITVTIWTHANGGAMEGAKRIDAKSNNLREAAKLAVAAGYTLRGEAQWMVMYGGIVVPVVAKAAKEAAS